MPIVSKAMQGAMYAAKAGNSTLGIPQSVGAEFVAAGPKGGSFAKLPARKETEKTESESKKTEGKEKKKPGNKMQKAFNTGRISAGAMAKAGY